MHSELTKKKSASRQTTALAPATRPRAGAKLLFICGSGAGVRRRRARLVVLVFCLLNGWYAKVADSHTIQRLLEGGHWHCFPPVPRYRRAATQLQSVDFFNKKSRTSPSSGSTE
jgi:hypothetical protein